MRPLAQLPSQSVCGSVSSFQGVSSSGWFESAEGSSILLPLSPCPRLAVEARSLVPV